MRRTRYKNYRKASLSLASVLGRKVQGLRPMVAPAAAGAPEAASLETDSEITPLLIEVSDPEVVRNQVGELGPDQEMTELAGGFFSARVGESAARNLIRNRRVRRIQTKKAHKLKLDEAGTSVGLRVPSTGPRTVEEDGTGVLIGIVDSGFDLSHPMFRDDQNQLRVDGLLDQVTGLEHDPDQLQQGWSNGTKPGHDGNGHGTHVATIAGGSTFGGFEGVAPGTRFLLVKTNMLDTADAVDWIFKQAGDRPCVVNMSLGHHWGSHDGTDAEERFQASVVGPGKIITVAAGNERNDDIHIGGVFHSGLGETVLFDVLRQPDRAPLAVITLWYSDEDSFDIDLVTPSGQALRVPALGNTDFYSSSQLQLELGASEYGLSDSVQVQIVLSFDSMFVADNLLQGWGLHLRSKQAVYGRLDGWMNNSGFARFRPHPLVSESRTVGLPATGGSVLAIASHVSKDRWESDLGSQEDVSAVVGRSSSFSSLGPTRDGRWKPDVSAPGQYLTAALAEGSSLGNADDRARVVDRLVSIEGTSMAAPLVAGIVALLLQRNSQLDTETIRSILEKTAVRDGHTGTGIWNPTYGFGKINIQAALEEVSSENS